MQGFNFISVPARPSWLNKSECLGSAQITSDLFWERPLWRVLAALSKNLVSGSAEKLPCPVQSLLLPWLCPSPLWSSCCQRREPQWSCAWDSWWAPAGPALLLSQELASSAEPCPSGAACPPWHRGRVALECSTPRQGGGKAISISSWERHSSSVWVLKDLCSFHQPARHVLYKAIWESSRVTWFLKFCCDSKERSFSWWIKKNYWHNNSFFLKRTFKGRRSFMD